jgi:hypothetical protein
MVLKIILKKYLHTYNTDRHINQQHNRKHTGTRVGTMTLQSTITNMRWGACRPHKHVWYVGGKSKSRRTEHGLRSGDITSRLYTRKGGHIWDHFFVHINTPYMAPRIYLITASKIITMNIRWGACRLHKYVCHDHFDAPRVTSSETHF